MKWRWHNECVVFYNGNINLGRYLGRNLGAWTMKYFATFVESGTNYRCYIEAETREGIQAKLLGRVYPPKQATIAIYRRKESV